MISSSVFGQDVGTTEIKILEGFKPVIPQATRLNDNASFDDTLKKDRTQIFEILDANLGSDYKIKPLAVAKVKNAKITKLYKTQIAAAFGNVHGVYKPGNVKLTPTILQKSQEYVSLMHNTNSNPINFVFTAQFKKIYRFFR